MAKRQPSGEANRPARAKRSSQDPLTPLRESIDKLDERLIRLLSQRAKVVQRIGRAKQADGGAIYAPHREAAVLDRVLEKSHEIGSPLPDRTVEAIYKELMSGSFRIERPLRIAYLGPPGSYSHMAATKQFGASVDYEELGAIDGVFQEVARGDADYGLVPIENSTGGSIFETLDAFRARHAQVCVYSEIQVAVRHAFFARCDPDDVEKITSKHEVFSQCRQWLAARYRGVELAPAASTSAAVRAVANAPLRRDGSEPRVAAIGGVLAGELVGLRPIFESIEDSDNNITRFFVIGREPAKRAKNNKTTIMFSTADKPGALVEVLSVFHRAGVNLTHIDKRPSGRTNWTYTFFVDAQGHVDDESVSTAIRRAKKHCPELHVLGSYPRAVRILG